MHKTQGLTLDKTAVLLNEDMFAPGHAYTALSRVRRWEDVDVMDLHPDAFRVDHDAVAEYRRLEQLAQLLSYSCVGIDRPSISYCSIAIINGH